MESEYFDLLKSSSLKPIASSVWTRRAYEGAEMAKFSYPKVRVGTATDTSYGFQKVLQDGLVNGFESFITITLDRARVPDSYFRAEISSDFSSKMRYLLEKHNQDSFLIKDVNLRLRGTIVFEIRNSWTGMRRSAGNTKFDSVFLILSTSSDSGPVKVMGRGIELNGHLPATEWFEEFQASVRPEHVQYLLDVSVSLNARLEWAWKPTPSKNIKIKMDNEGFLKKLFTDDDSKDFTIIAGNGAEIKCHKIVLKMQNGWFGKMLEKSGTVEAETGKLKLEGLSEEGLEYLVGFLYGMEIPTDKLTPEMTLELLQNGHAYQLSEFVQPITTLLIQKNEDWFQTEDEVDALVELYLLAEKLEGNGQLEFLSDHLLGIMARIPSSKLKTSQSFLELDKKAMTDLLFKIVDVLKPPNQAPNQAKSVVKLWSNNRLTTFN